MTAKPAPDAGAVPATPNPKPPVLTGGAAVKVLEDA